VSRPVRVEFPGAFYDVMSHGVSGSPAFLDDRDHRTFLGALKEFVAIGKLIVFAYALMRTHFHLLLQTPLASHSSLAFPAGSLGFRYFIQAADRQDGSSIGCQVAESFQRLNS
jgi:hypothetical protein